MSLPRAEAAARGMFVVPLFPHLSEAEQGRVAAAVGEALAAEAEGR